MRKRFNNYQVDGPKYVKPLVVADLTEEQAKDELCDAMDTIEKLEDLYIRMGVVIVKWGKGIK